MTKGFTKGKGSENKKVHSQWVTPEVCQIVWPQVKIWFTRAKKLIFRFSASGVLKSYKIGYYTPPRNVFLKWAIKNQIVPFICLNLTHWPLVPPGTLLMLVVDPPPLPVNWKSPWRLCPVGLEVWLLASFKFIFRGPTLGSPLYILISVCIHLI